MRAPLLTRSTTSSALPVWRFWRRSLHARIVASVLVLAVVAAAITGWFLLRSVRDGLLDAKVSSVRAETLEEMNEAKTRLTSSTATEPEDVATQRRDLVEPIIDHGITRGFDVVLSGPSQNEEGLVAGGAEYSAGLDLSSVPEALIHHFARATVATAWTYTSIRTVDRPRGTNGIVVGSQFVLPADGETYTLYFLYPLDTERQTLSLVTRVMAFSGLILIVLLALGAWWIGRRVVAPIRLAREVAERLSAGELRMRMQVSGEDDLARLATSFNQMAAALQRQIVQLEELSRLQRRFTSDVSHELRTPLTTVRMASELIHDARSGFDPATARAAELLVAELDRFEELLVDLLEISRYDAGAARLDLERVNLSAVVRRVAAAAQSLATQKGVRLVVRAPRTHVMVEIDTRRIERILRNLVDNAIDHAGDHDTVLVTVAAGDHDTVAVGVRDHGVGLTQEQAGMVFDRFWRADPARARTTGGTGLGLAISLEDARLHGGTITAWGELGKGANFVLVIPTQGGGVVRTSPLPRIPKDAEVSR